MTRKMVCCRCGEFKDLLTSQPTEWGFDRNLDFFLICDDCQKDLTEVEELIKENHKRAMERELKAFRVKEIASFKFKLKDVKKCGQ